MIRVVFFWGRQKWRFRIVAANGKILATSEAYTNREDCLAAGRLILGASERDEAHLPSWDAS
jgi:uncharacterized protein YegP (UPF0339 family)